MRHWFDDSIVATGRLPLFCFFWGLVVAFLFIRASVRLIRAQVRWWPGNVTPGGLHVHHAVFGVLMMVVGGVLGLAVPDKLVGWTSAAAGLFGVGTALVLDEFALILHLEDVYWKEAGRASVDTVFAAVALTGLILLRITPIGISDVGDARGQYPGIVGWLLGAGYTLANLAFVVVSLLKGKRWTGLIGLFIPMLAVIGSVRLSRPSAPWARWRYRGHPRKMARARRRERRLRAPLIRAKIAVENVVSGRPDQPSGPDTTTGHDEPGTAPISGQETLPRMPPGPAPDAAPPRRDPGAAADRDAPGSSNPPAGG